jgi:hypothetical protein
MNPFSEQTFIEHLLSDRHCRTKASETQNSYLRRVQASGDEQKAV